MDSLAFLVTLAVAIAVIVWFVFNEAQGGDGALGLFAIRRDDADAEKDAEETIRYRRRERLIPERRAGLKTPGAGKAYRAKPPEKPAYQRDAGAAAKDD